MRKSTILTIILLFSLVSAHAQTARRTISGYVREQGSRELLPGVNVYIPELKVGTVTNNYGFYSITIPDVKPVINFSFVGYQTVLLKTDSLSSGVVNVELRPSLSLREVVVTGQAPDHVSNTTKTDYISVPAAQIKAIPALLGEKDVFKTLQLLPGVKKGQEGTSGIYVRGGGPDQNLIILDDATVYNVNHLFGFFSIFNGDAIKSVELTKGGFPAHYGGRLSSVVEMNMKDGNKEKITGEAGIGLISSRFTLEGPLKKNVSSFLISARRTYIDALMAPLIQSENAKPVMYFYDLNAKVNYDFGYKNKLYLSGYFGRDKFGANEYETDDRYSAGLYWQNATATLRWNHVYNGRLFSNASFVFSNYGMSIFDKYAHREEGEWKKYSLDYTSGIRDFSLKYDFDFHLVSGYLIRFGAIATQHQFRPSAIVKIDDETPFNNYKKITRYNSVENAVYMENHYTVNDRFQVNGGFRVSHFYAEQKNYLHLEPRLSMNYQFAPNTSAKVSYADMNQCVHLLSNTGLGLPTDLWVPSTGKVAPQNSRQVSLGLAHDFTGQKQTFTLDGYYKTMNHIISYKPGASFMMIDGVEGAENYHWQDNVIAGEGKAYGVEMMLQRKTGRLSGWVGYTLSWVKHRFDELNSGEWFYPKYDRRHDLSVVGIYEISKRVTLSGSWVYGTGNAFTMPEGEYFTHTNSLKGNLSSFDVNSYYSYYSQSKATDYGKYNASRMVPYHRLDLSIAFKKQKKHWERTWEFGVYNAYSRKNPFFYMIDSEGETNKLKLYSLFPMIPSVTYNIKF